MIEERPQSSLVLYQSEDGRTRVQCRFEDGTVWLSQLQLAELFQTTVANINTHLKAVFAEGELRAEATIKSYLIVRSEGSRQVSREVMHYSLPAILAVGYRVRSARGTQFRQWATATLSEFVLKGFALDDQRLKNPPGPGVPDYFDELLARIRDIRASERRMYTRVRDILALAADYQPGTEHSTRLFQIVQNKLHHAVTGMTAPELIASRADARQPNMGLTTWSGGSVQKADVTVAKNFLREQEITELNRIVTMFLDYAEDQAERKRELFMRDWPVKLDEFLRFNERRVLPDAGSMTPEAANTKAGAEYEAFATRRRALAEEKGEADNIKALEAAAKTLTKRPRKAPGKGRVS